MGRSPTPSVYSLFMQFNAIFWVAQGTAEVRSGSCWPNGRAEGSPLAGAMRVTTLYSVGSRSTQNYEAIIRFYGEAPRRRVHSRYGIKAMAVFGSPQPRIIIGQ